MNHFVRNLLIVAAILLVLILAGVWVVRVGLNNSRGDFGDLLAGQYDTGPELKQKDVSNAGDPAGGVYSVTLRVDSNTLATLPDEYLSFAVDSSQLVGGKWWNPDASGKEVGSGTVNTPPMDFNRPQLDKLVSALAPAYLRIGGSEADKIYYDMSQDVPSNIPAGYHSALGRSQWDAAVQFAVRNKLKLVFTLNAGPAVRSSGGAWEPGNAKALLDYSAAKKYPVTGWELGNEVNIFWFVHGLNQQVKPAQYAQDMKTARDLVKQYYPTSTFSGQGSAYWPILGEPLNYFFSFMPEYLAKAGSLTDIVSWHYYPQQSRRGPIATRRATPGRLLDPNNLNEAAYWATQVNDLRGQYARGAQLWLGETGNAQFGGEPGVSDAYIGGLWWLDELGLLAKYHTQVVVRQSLTGMNYGLIDDATLTPRPDYWNSYLWKKLMGNTVYKTGVFGANNDKLRAYAQSIPGEKSGKTVLLINLDPKNSAQITLPDFANQSFEIFALSTPDLFGQMLFLNGKPLALDSQGSVPELFGSPVLGNGVPQITINPLSYMFVVFPPTVAVQLVP